MLLISFHQEQSQVVKEFELINLNSATLFPKRYGISIPPLGTANG